MKSGDPFATLEQVLLIKSAPPRGAPKKSKGGETINKGRWTS